MSVVILWTLRQRKRSIIGWSIGVAAFIFINLIFYPSFKDQAAELQKSFENLPDAAVQLLGGSTDFFSPVGFMNSQIFFIMLPLLFGILAINLGSKLLAQEEQENTIELLLARPISRSKLLAAKAISGIIILTIVAAVSLLVTILVSKAVGVEIGSAPLIAATFMCFVLALSFGAIAFMISAFGKARAISLGVATAVALGGYLISSLSNTVSWLEAPSKILPFNYYKSEAILSGNADWSYLVYFAVLLFVAWLISVSIFRKRDIG